MFMFVLNILCHNLLTRIFQRVGYEMSEPGYESSGYERSMGTKQLVTVEMKEISEKLLKIIITLSGTQLILRQ